MRVPSTISLIESVPGLLARLAVGSGQWAVGSGQWAVRGEVFGACGTGGGAFPGAPFDSEASLFPQAR